ncbi:MAG: 2'-5' RNA ligase family protein [Chloroflexi bacterium]|nr:2'-5' RNA ligase family protein [Chloroflexota bacterium]
MREFDRERYALIIRLPREVEVRIEDTYLGLVGITKPTMGFHITLLGPFYLSEGVSIESLCGVADVCARWQPFRVRVYGLGTFEVQEDNIVYLHVADSERVMALHDDLLEAASACVTYQSEQYEEWNVDSYYPHVTLGLGLSDQELSNFLRDAANRVLDETFEVSRIWIAAQPPSGSWHYVATYTLGVPTPQPLTPCSDNEQ